MAICGPANQGRTRWIEPLLLVLSFLLYSRVLLAQDSPTSRMASAGKLLTEKAPLLTYKNKRYGISFKYLEHYQLREGEPGTTGIFQGPWQENRIGLATVEMPFEAYPDSDLSSAFISIGINEHLTQRECEELPYKVGNPEGPPTSPRIIRISGIQFSGTEGGGVAGGSAYDETDYVAFRNNICYQISVETVVATALLGEHLDGFTLPVDYEDVVRGLRSILSRLRIRPPKAERIN